MKSQLLVCVFLVTYATGSQLPSTFKKCDIKSSHFNDCLTSAIPDAVRLLKRPFRQIGLPSMDPLVIPAMSISPGPGILNFQQNYTNLKISGFVDISCRRNEFKFEDKTLTLDCRTPQIRMLSNYSFNGSISVLPIYGNGDASVILDDVKCFHAFRLEEYHRRGRKHFKVVNSTFTVNAGKVRYKFDNLYDGNKFMGDNVNLVMNDNWKEIFDDIKPSYEEGLTTVFAFLFNQVLSRVPVSDLFING